MQASQLLQARKTEADVESVCDMCSKLTIPQVRRIKPQGYKTVFMLNSTEHEIASAHKTKMKKNDDFFLSPKKYCGFL